MTTHSEAPRKYTASEFLQFPDDFPPHSQLIHGQVVVSEPNVVHGRVQIYLQHELMTWCEGAAGRGEVFVPVDVRVDDSNVIAPDVLWYREERRPPKGALRVEGMPDLAIEVRSPSTWRYDTGPKFVMYERGGVRELWLVDTHSRSVFVYRRSKDDSVELDEAQELGLGATLTSPLLPDFAVDIAQLFDR